MAVCATNVFVRVGLVGSGGGRVARTGWKGEPGSRRVRVSASCEVSVPKVSKRVVHVLLPLQVCSC